MLVTVVVPVYKTEKYLDRCVSSIINQTHTKLEIILVDDGSPDSCPERCDWWSQQDSRILVIHKENAGLGMARNTGIEHASGDYICFVDSDDYILPQTISSALKTAQSDSAEITIYGFILEDKQGRQRPIIPDPKQKVYCAEDVRSVFLPEYIGEDPRTGKNSGIPGSACACLISLPLIRQVGWRFVSEREILCEDVYSMMKLCADVTTISVMDQAFYCYCENDASLTHTYLPDRFEKAKVYYEKSLEVCLYNGYPVQTQRRCMEQFIGCAIGSLKQNAIHYSDKKLRMHHLRRIVDDPVFQQVLLEKRKDTVRLKKRVLYWAIRNRQYQLCDFLLNVKNTTGL